MASYEKKSEWAVIKRAAEDRRNGFRRDAFDHFFPLFRERCAVDAETLHIAMGNEAGGVDFRLQRDDVFALRVLRQADGDIRTELLQSGRVIQTTGFGVEEVDGDLAFRAGDRSISYQDMPEVVITMLLKAQPDPSIH